jgi:peptidylamidoglycolate lyase
MPIIKHKIYLIIILVVFFISCSNTKNAYKKNTSSELPKYELVKDWLQIPKGTLKQVTGIGVDNSQNVLLLVRTGRAWSDVFPDSLISNNTVFLFNKETGKIMDSWGANLFIMPHSLTVDKNNNVWITDVGLHQVFKLTHNGQLLMKWGVPQTSGNDSLHFDFPTDVAVANDSSFYVSDGYGNSRIVKFSKEGKYFFEWGKKGNGPGEFNIPHGIDLDAKGNVYVADRENNRIQKFTAEGVFLKEWKNDRAKQLYYVVIDKTKNKLIATEFFSDTDKDNKGADLLLFDSNLKLLDRFGQSDVSNNINGKYHDMAIDNKGNIYACDIRNNTIQKFKRVIIR